MWWNSGTVMVERWNSVKEQWNSHGGTAWWNSGTVMVEQSKGTVEKKWWNSGKVMVGQCGGTVEQSWWNSVVEHWNIDGRTV